MVGLRRFTLDLSRPEGGWGDLQSATARARSAALQVQGEGVPVRFLRSIFVPEDDACLFLYEGSSAQAVRDTASRAMLPVGQVEETLRTDPEGGA